MASISDSWGSEETKCNCTEWAKCDYCKEKKEDEEIKCNCTEFALCGFCKEKTDAYYLAEYDEYMNETGIEECKYCEEDKSLCDCSSCFCCCRQNARILFKILEDKSGLNKKTYFTYKYIIEKNSDFKEYVEKNVGIENIKILYYKSLDCTNCCKRHQVNKPLPLLTGEFCITIHDSDSDSEEEH